MATWTTLPDTTLEPGKPIRSIDVLALRDNPVAIAEGAAGAPRVSWNAIEDQSHVVAWNASTTSINYNSTIAGGDLRLASTSTSSVSFTPYVGGAIFNTGFGVVSLTGTWRNIGGRCIGRTGGPTEYYFYPSIWVRIA